MLESCLPSDFGQILLRGTTTLIHLLWLTGKGIVAHIQRLTTQYTYVFNMEIIVLIRTCYVGYFARFGIIFQQFKC